MLLIMWFFFFNDFVLENRTRIWWLQLCIRNASKTETSVLYFVCLCVCVNLSIWFVYAMLTPYVWMFLVNDDHTWKDPQNCPSSFCFSTNSAERSTQFSFLRGFQLPQWTHTVMFFECAKCFSINYLLVKAVARPNSVCSLWLWSYHVSWCMSTLRDITQGLLHMGIYH